MEKESYPKIKISCIFHAPYPLIENGKAGSEIRPIQMLTAFKEIFEDVFVLTGYGNERKRKFAELKKQVKQGKKYAFLYSENSTMPNLMTEKNHLPLHPFLEKDIFEYCKKEGIATGVFYRDIYWKFPVYKQMVAFWKRCITLSEYKFDLWVYKKNLDILFLPSKEMEQYVGSIAPVVELPPGMREKSELDVYEEDKMKPLTLFYVGGVGGNYDLTKLIEGMSRCSFANLILCCHEDQWLSWKKRKGIELPNNITLIHLSGAELEKYYRISDIGVFFFDPSGYMKMTMPIKIFEYLQYRIPVIAVNQCAFSDFIERHDIGWTIDFQVEEFVKLLFALNADRSRIVKKRDHMDQCANTNTWNARALTVYKALCLNKVGMER